ncbi:MAG: hypothetical protein ACEPO2_11245 [Pelagibaca sp.]
MEPATATFVRLLLAEEFVPPSGWPEDVGVAVIRTNGPEVEIFPVHRQEGPAALLRRIEEFSGIALGAAAVYPPVEGHPECDLPQSTLRDLVSGIEKFLASSPDVVEEAEDFAVNFAFAAEEGIDLSGALTPTTHAPPAVLPGYVPLKTGAAGLRPFPNAVLRIAESGEALVILNPSLPLGAIATPEILLRDDGIGFAVSRDAVMQGQHEPYALQLAPGSLPKALERRVCDIPLACFAHADHVLFTPILAFAVQPAVSTTPAGAAISDAKPSSWRIQRAVGAVAGVALIAAVAMFSSAPTRTLQPETPVDALRAGLF